jgi:hypothetical protein
VRGLTNTQPFHPKNKSEFGVGEKIRADNKTNFKVAFVTYAEGVTKFFFFTNWGLFRVCPLKMQYPFYAFLNL